MTGRRSIPIVTGTAFSEASGGAFSELIGYVRATGLRLICLTGCSGRYYQYGRIFVSRQNAFGC